MRRQKWATRGGRVSQQGFRLIWAGLAMLIVLLIAGIAHAPGAVVVALVAAMFAMDLAGLGIVVRGHRIDRRDLAAYQRKVAAGEEPAWTPGEQPQQP